MRTVHLGRQKEKFDAKMYVVLEAMRIAEETSKKEEVRRVAVFMDFPATLRRIQSDKPEPGQVLALWTMRWERDLLKKDMQVQYW